MPGTRAGIDFGAAGSGEKPERHEGRKTLNVSFPYDMSLSIYSYDDEVMH
jgi:hypothetical protein